MGNKAEDGGTVVRAVVHAVAILRRLAIQPEGAGVNAIARAAGVSPSSCFNILRTLVREDLVEFDPVAKTYATGAGLTALLGNADDAQSVLVRCSPLLQDVAERHGATAVLWRIAPTERLVLLGFAESPSATRIHMTVGQRLPMLAGAAGRCAAAMLGLSPAEIAQRFSELRWANRPTLSAYQQEVAKARTDGWALDDGEFLSGVTTLAAAVPAVSTRPTYVMSATVFRGQLSPAELKALAMDLKVQALRIGEASRRD